MAAVRPAGEFPDASEMLAEALKQMDGLLAGNLLRGNVRPSVGTYVCTTVSPQKLFPISVKFGV